VSEQFLNGTSADVSLFRGYLVHCHVMVDLDKNGDISKAI